MFREINTYRHTAHLYDVDTLSIKNHDIDFWLSCAGETTGPILELACGTGRVGLELAEAGHSLVGLDISPSMLAIFKEKIMERPAAVRERISLVEGDMAHFQLGQKFSLIIIPFRGFQALTDPRVVANALAAIRNHLAEGGRCIIDLYLLRGSIEQFSPRYREQVHWVRIVPETGRAITKARVTGEVDHHNQTVATEDIYIIELADGSQKVLQDRFLLKYYRHHQAQLLWCSSGFGIDAEYGNYHRQPVGYGSEHIYVLT